jgi:hypothetical protein
MEKYHKIQTVYFRDLETKKLSEGKWAKPEFKLLKDINWICTEKVDGTNVRIIWDGENVKFKGKTDNAQLPTLLFEALQKIFTNEKLQNCFQKTPVCLYGEGYGVKIQKGGNYLRDSNNFVLFDVKIEDWWLERENIEGISDKLEIDIVPIICSCSLQEAIEYVKKGFKSTIAVENKDYLAEGLILKPEVELFNRKKERIITKIKYKDFER